MDPTEFMHHDRHAGEYVIQFLKEVDASASDRIVLIVGAAMLDLQLERILKKVLHPSRKSNWKEDELFGYERPLSSMAAKTDLAFRMGIIQEWEHKAISAIRKLRNDHAHEVIPAPLDEGKHADLIRDVAQPYRKLLDIIMPSYKFPETPSGILRGLLHSIGPMLSSQSLLKPLSEIYAEATENMERKRKAENEATSSQPTDES